MCKSHLSLSHCHPFLRLPVLLHGWNSSRDRTQLPLHGPAPHLVGLLVQLKLYNTLFRSLQHPHPHIHEHTCVCSHKSQVFLTFPYFAESNGFRCTSCGWISSSFSFLVNVLSHQKSDLKHFYTMKEKRESFDSENIFIYFFFNTIAASNILVLMFQREERRGKHSETSFHSYPQELYKKIFQSCSALWFGT